LIGQKPKISARHVLVRIQAASLNYRDLVVMRGQYDRSPQLGRIPLSDGAGEVISVGSEVTRFKPGDRVAGSFFQGWISGRFRPEFHRTALGGSIDGVLAELVAFSEEGLVPVPNYLTLIEAATLPCAALTAWQALVVRGETGRRRKCSVARDGRCIDFWTAVCQIEWCESDHHVE